MMRCRSWPPVRKERKVVTAVVDIARNKSSRWESDLPAERKSRNPGHACGRDE